MGVLLLPADRIACWFDPSEPSPPMIHPWRNQPRVAALGRVKSQVDYMDGEMIHHDSIWLQRFQLDTVPSMIVVPCVC